MEKALSETRTKMDGMDLGRFEKDTVNDNVDHVSSIQGLKPSDVSFLSHHNTTIASYIMIIMTPN